MQDRIKLRCLGCELRRWQSWDTQKYTATIIRSFVPSNFTFNTTPQFTFSKRSSSLSLPLSGTNKKIVYDHRKTTKITPYTLIGNMNVPSINPSPTIKCPPPTSTLFRKTAMTLVSVLRTSGLDNAICWPLFRLQSHWDSDGLDRQRSTI